MANTILLVTLFFFSMTLSSSSNPKHFTVELIHRDSPHSPLYNPQTTLTDRLHSSFLRSISRSHRFNNHPQTDLQSGLIGAGGEFFMSITIGTPPINVLAIADTGSDLTWVQCKPCQQCYKENGPIFDSKQSSSYKSEPCDSRNCNALSTTERGCDEAKGVCKYRSPVSFPGTVFGCGYNNGGNFDETGSGIIGLGGGNLSLISQLGSSISNKFSYCLSHKSSTMNGTSVINLGTSSIPSGASNVSNVVSTPLVDKEPQTYYYLTLEAISVGNTKIPYTSSMYYPNDDGVSSAATKGNIIIDSGTTLTLLESGFYDKFGAAVEESVTGAKRVSDPQGLLSHCFKSGSAEIGLPEITVHFSGADVRLSALNAFVKMSEDMVCLSMIPTNEVAIYGNFAQMDFLVGYDLETRRVSFQRMDCSADL
ncbi:BnaA05g08400D [Brassica napus]|uniref:BnaA05g08400D protein n=1 Tax=Brassica napus TaxID=3708 RepID=A0A078H2G5_BRANA|nr:BnaA05g08400D [Brassica napus]